ncbi:MAG: hypothetical protein ACYDBQ_09450 [Thermoplasmatota archaeon]
MARRHLRGDDGGQMMLLSAVVLIIAFVALTGMVARVAQLAKTTTTEASSPTINGIEPMLTGANLAIANLLPNYNVATSAGRWAYQNATLAAAQHLEALEAGQGYVMSFALGCQSTGGALDALKGQYNLTLDDGTLQATVHTQFFRRPVTLAGNPVTSANATVGSIAIPVPWGTQAGDLLFAQVVESGAVVTTVAPPLSGWTLVDRISSGATFGQAIYDHVATASEPASYTWTFVPNLEVAGGMVSYRSPAPASIDVRANQTALLGTSVVAPSVTTTRPDDTILAFFATQAAAAFAPPATMSEAYDSANPTRFVPAIDVGGEPITGPGASGTRTAIATSSGANIGELIALTPGACTTLRG